MASIRVVLFDPDVFLARRKTPTVVTPALIVTTLGALGVATPVLALWLVNDLGGFWGTFVTVSVLGFAAPFIVWLFYGVAFYAVSSAFNAEGSLRDTVIFTGWGFLPSVVYSVLTLVVVALFFGNSVRSEATPSSGNVLAMLGVSSSALKFVSILFTLWSAYIWVAAVEHTAP